jgi:HAD superfamily hydrolase (TIGR01509 family)
MIGTDLVIFDCDGVLVDSELLSCRSLTETLAEQGIEIDVEQALELFVGRDVEAVQEHFGALGLVLPNDFKVRLARRVRAAFTGALLPIDGVAAMLEALQVPRCVASSSDLERVRLSLELTGLARYFGERLYTSQMVERGKPAPDLFLYAAAAMQADPRRTLVIEDSVSGVTAARAAGMTVWGFVGGSHYASRDGRAILTRAGADRIFARMSEFWPKGLQSSNGQR